MNRVNRRKLVPPLVLAAMLAVLVLAPTASAQSSSVGTYAGAGGSIASNVEPGEASATDPGSTSAGALPFTGVDLALIAGAGVVLLILGVSVARLLASERARRPDPSPGA